MNTHQPTVILGAGPYGLAAAAHLTANNIPFRIFGDTMASWEQNMPRGMFLKSAPDSTDIATPIQGHQLRDFCAEQNLGPYEDGVTPIPIDTFSSYGHWFAKKHAFCVEPAQAEHVRAFFGSFDVTLTSGEHFQTPQIINATGHVAHAYTPTPLRALLGEPHPDNVLSHSSQHADLSVFAGQRVAVVGAGQSALETAALLTESGAVPMLFARQELRWGGLPAHNGDRRPWRETALKSPLGAGLSLRTVHDGAGLIRYLPAKTRLKLVHDILGPMGAGWLQPRVVGHVITHPQTRIKGAVETDHGVRLAFCGHENGSVGVDHVIAATGYRYNVGALRFLDATIRHDIACTGGFPILSPTLESSVRNLYFTGLAAGGSFGPLLRFVCGTGFASRRIVRGVSRAREMGGT